MDLDYIRVREAGPGSEEGEANLPAEDGKYGLTTWSIGLWRRLGIYALMSALFTMMLVNYSLQYGRLAVGPTDDDAVYMVDALQRLDILHRSLKDFALNLIAYPPHSPFSTLLGVLSFGVFGPHQWAPYVGSGLIVLGLLLAVDYILAGKNWWIRMSGALFALSFPFTGVCVTEFRPDCAVGIVTAFGLLLLLRTSPLAATREQALTVGLFAAAALLIKPAFVAFTIIAFAAAWLASAFVAHEIPRRLGDKSWLKTMLWYALPGLVLALPYYFLAPKIIHYIYNNAFGKYKHEWAHSEVGADSFRFYWDGVAGQIMLGRHRYVVLAFALVALILGAASIRQWWRFATAYLIVLVVTFAIPAMIGMGNPYFAASTVVLILFAGVLLLAQIMSDDGSHAGLPMVNRVVAIVAVIFAIISFHWPRAIFNEGDLRTEMLNRLGQQIYTVIHNHPGSRNARVFFTVPGPVDDMLLRYHALVNGRNFWCPNLHVVMQLEPYRREIERADFVVAAEPGSDAVYESMLAGGLQASALEIAQTAPGLMQIAQLPALNGKSFFVFVRRSLTEADAERVKTLPFNDPWAPLYAR